MVVLNLSPIPQKQSSKSQRTSLKGCLIVRILLISMSSPVILFFFNERKRFIYFEKQAKTLSYWTKYKEQTSWDGTAKYSQKITLRNPFKHFRAQPAEVSPGRLHLFHWKRAGVESQERTRLRLAPKTQCTTTHPWTQTYTNSLSSTRYWPAHSHSNCPSRVCAISLSSGSKAERVKKAWVTHTYSMKMQSLKWLRKQWRILLRREGRKRISRKQTHIHRVTKMKPRWPHQGLALEKKHTICGAKSS